MSFFVITVALALGIALLAGGDLRRILETPLRGKWALSVALALQVALDLFWRRGGDDVGHFLLVVSYALLIGFCAANLALRGMSIVLIGIALNAAVITLNHGMPIRTDARVKETVKHHVEQPSDRLTGLSDIIVVDPLNQALSFGDLILMVGLVDVLVHRSRPAPSRMSLAGGRDPLPNG